MIWLTWKLLTLPFRIVFGTIGLVFRLIGLIGVRRLFVLGLGVAIGLLVAPKRGEELRRELRQRVEEARAGDLSTRVRQELARSSRTAHLVQPTVTVVDSTVTLVGEAPSAMAKEDLGKVAMGVAGVTSVDNRLTVAGG